MRELMFQRAQEIHRDAAHDQKPQCEIQRGAGQKGH